MSPATPGKTAADDGAGRLFTKDFGLAISANFFISMVFYLLMTTMAFYAVEMFGTSDTLGGLASSSFIFGALVARVIVGKYMDFVGRKKILMIALISFVVTGLLYLVVGDIWWLIGLRVLHGAGFGAANTALGASVMLLLPPLRRGEGTGYFGISTTLSTAVGPALAVLAMEVAGFDALFILSAASAAMAVLLATFLSLPERSPSPAEVSAKHRWRLSDVLDPGALPISTIMAFAGLAYASILAFVNSFAQAEGLSAGIFFLVYAGAMLVARLFLGRVQDHYGDNVVSYPTLISFVASFVMLAVAHHDWQLVVAALLAGFGFGAFMPIFQTIAVTQAPDHRVAITTSTFYILLDIGTVIGPMAAGALVGGLGYSGMFLAMAAVMAVATVVYHFVHGHKRYVRRLHYEG